MNREEVLALLRKTFGRFRNTLWFRITYLVLLGLIVAELYGLTASAVACVIVLLMPVSVFVVPYWLGERKLKRLAFNGLPVFAIAILVAGAMSTQGLLVQNQAIPLQSFPGPFSNPTMALTNGTVAPYHAPPTAPFTFRVKLTTTVNGTPGSYNVSVNLTKVTRAIGFLSLEPQAVRMAYSPGGTSSSNTKNGTWYEARLNLTDALYAYAFAVQSPRSSWTSTDLVIGPLTASDWTFYGFFVNYTALQMILPFVFYYLILFLWWYTIRNREARARRMGSGAAAEPAKAERKEPKQPKEATAGGKAAKAAAFTCTNCGVDVSESDTKCPKCGAVFED
ncbi:MAG: zinc ribbon domain-containing protein [Thermoplasmata archaeon]|nr:zinc ribbon domain-containing protein [Thermoplasmata archaeon]